VRVCVCVCARARARSRARVLAPVLEWSRMLGLLGYVNCIITGILPTVTTMKHIYDTFS
jgi:hypothetical protein